METTQLSGLWDYLRMAIFENRLVIIAITSSAQGAIPIQGFKFGQGKSVLLMGLLKAIYELAYNCDEATAEEHVKVAMGYPLKDVKRMLIGGRKRRWPGWGQDDWQVVAGKHMSHDKGIKKLAAILSSSRPYCGVFITTQPDLGTIAKCMRDLYMFEIKIPYRGLCEIQQLKTWTNFKDPLNPITKLDPVDQSEFPMVSDSLIEWYRGWRDENFTAEFDAWCKDYLDEDKPTPEPVEQSAASEAGRLLSQTRWNKPSPIV